MERIVLAYSGRARHVGGHRLAGGAVRAEVIAVTLDLGQGRELTDVRERALAVGAARAHVLDVARRVRARLHPAGAAGRRALRGSLSARDGARPAADRAASWSKSRGWKARPPSRTAATARRTTSCASSSASARSIRRSRSWRRRASGACRGEEIVAYAKARQIPIPSTIDSPYTVDTNLWGRSIERGVLEDPWQESPEDIYALTRSPQTCPDEPAYVEVEFEQGVPVRANGVEMPLVELIESLETIAGAHGVGRIDMVENATSGVKSREIYEAPAAVVLHTAHSELEKLVIPRDLERLAHDLGRAYADLAYNGRWFSPTREAIDAFMRTIQPRVTRRRPAEALSRATAASSAAARRWRWKRELPHAPATQPPASEGSIH